MSRFLKFYLLPLIAVLFLGSCSMSEEEMAKVTGKGGCEPISDYLNFKSSTSYNKLTIPDCKTRQVCQNHVCHEEITTNCKDRGIIDWLNSKITSSIKGASLMIWLKLSLNVEYRFMLSMMLTVSVLLFTGSILLGITQASGYNITIYMFKVIIIYQLAVNYIYFNIYVIQSFESLLTDTLMAVSLTFSDYIAPSAEMACMGAFGSVACSISDMITSLFGINILSLLGISNDSQLGQAMLFPAMDNMMSWMLDFRLWKLIITLSAMGNNGIFYGIMMFVLIIAYLSSIIIAVKTFLLAYIARWVLYGLGPIFISFALFNQTRSLFDGWLQQLINFTLQPMFLFIFLGMFHSMLTGFLSQIFVDLSGSLQQTEIVAFCELHQTDCTDMTGVQTCTSPGTIALTGSNPPCDCGAGNPSCHYRVITLGSNDMCIKYTDKFDKAGDETLKWFKICSKNGSQVTCYDTFNPTLPINIWVLIAAVIICYLMGAMCHWVTQVAAQLSSGVVTLSDVRILGMDKLTQGLKQGVGGLFRNNGTTGRTGGPPTS